MPPSPEDARRGLTRSPAQWEAEALAMVEEAERAQPGSPPGRSATRRPACSRTASAILAAAMDHLQLALDEPPVRDVPARAAGAAPARDGGGQPVDRASTCWTSRSAAATTVAEGGARCREGGPAGEPAGGARAGAGGDRGGAVAGPGPHRGPAGRGGGRSRGGDAALLQSVLDRRLAAAASAGERGRLLCRLALLAEANPDRTAEALTLFAARSTRSGQGAPRAWPARACGAWRPASSARRLPRRLSWRRRRARPARARAWMGRARRWRAIAWAPPRARCRWSRRRRRRSRRSPCCGRRITWRPATGRRPGLLDHHAELSKDGLGRDAGRVRRAPGGASRG